MNILHLCLACFYIDGYNYQENILPKINKMDGHNVKIIASTETYINNNHLGYISEGEYITEYGVPIERLPYKKIANKLLSKKIRNYPNLFKKISAFQPDVIMCHDAAFWSLKDVVCYKKKNPQVKLYVDTHTADYNSGTNFLSLYVLHRVIYRAAIRKAIPYIDKYFYIGESEKQFSLKNYGVPESLCEYYPLGGEVFSDEEYCEKRKRMRLELDVSDDQILFVHSGKLSSPKRTEDLVKAFSAVKNPKAKLVIIGSIPDSDKEVLTSFFKKDERILYLGWKKSTELMDYLCAGDIYCQPGSVSATMQNAICCRCGLILYPHDNYLKHYDYGNILWIETVEDMEKTFQNISDNMLDLKALSENSLRYAKEILDYNKLAARLYR